MGLSNMNLTIQGQRGCIMCSWSEEHLLRVGLSDAIVPVMNFRNAKSQPLAWLGKRCAGGSACFCLSVGAAPASGLRWTTQEGAFNTRRFSLLPSGSCTCLQARFSSAEPPWTWLRRLRTVGHLKSSLGKRVSIGCAPHPFHWRILCLVLYMLLGRLTSDLSRTTSGVVFSRMETTGIALLHCDCQLHVYRCTDSCGICSKRNALPHRSPYFWSREAHGQSPAHAAKSH